MSTRMRLDAPPHPALTWDGFEQVASRQGAPELTPDAELELARIRHVYGIGWHELDEELPEWEADLLARRVHDLLPPPHPNR